MDFANFGISLVGLVVAIFAFAFAKEINRTARFTVGSIGLICAVFFGSSGFSSLRGSTTPLPTTVATFQQVPSTPTLVSVAPTTTSAKPDQTAQPTTNPPVTIERTALKNFALGKPTTSSSTYPNNPNYFAVDDNNETGWSTGNYPSGWLEIDLQDVYLVSSIELVTAQNPDGETSHDLLVDDGSGAFQKVHTFKGFTSNHQKLVFFFDTPQMIAKVKIVTVSSPSWVAWAEVRVMGHRR